jgi:hypothetical protein
VTRRNTPFSSFIFIFLPFSSSSLAFSTIWLRCLVLAAHASLRSAEEDADDDEAGSDSSDGGGKRAAAAADDDD